MRQKQRQQEDKYRGSSPFDFAQGQNDNFLVCGGSGDDTFAGAAFEFLLKFLRGTVVQGVGDFDAIVAEDVCAAATRCSLDGHHLVVLDRLCGPEPEALRDRRGGEGDSAGHLQEDDDDCRKEEHGHPPWNGVSMGGNRNVEEEKNKGGQKDGACPGDHRLDTEDEAFGSLTS